MQVTMGTGDGGARRSRSARIVAGLGVTALGVAVASGCASRTAVGTKLGDGTATGAIQAAAQQVLSSKSVHVHGVMTSKGLTETIDGGLVFTPTFQGSVTMSISGGPTTPPTTGSADSLGGPGDGAAFMPTAMVFDGKTMYEKEGSAAPFSTTKPWLSIPTDGSAGGGPFGSFDMTNPQKLVAKALATGKFTLGVPQSVGGMSATDYAGVFDDSGNPVHVDLYLDQTGLPVEVKVVEDNSADGMIPAQNLDVRFSGWGTPVTITVPPADQVESMADMIKNMPTGYPSGVPSDLPSGFSTDYPSDYPTAVGFPTGPITIPGTGPTTCITEPMPAMPSGMPTSPEGEPTALTVCGPVDMVKP